MNPKTGSFIDCALGNINIFMVYAINQKFQNFKSNLNIKRTLGLIWSIAKGWTILSILAILTETLLFFVSFYLLKLLVDTVSKKDISSLEHEHLIRNYVIAAGAAAVLYAMVKGISSYIIEVQASKVAAYMDDRIHEAAVNLDYAYYESPDYFDILKRAKDAGADKPNLIITTLIELTKNSLNLLAVGSILLTIDWYLLPLLALFVFPTLLVRIHYANKLNHWRISHTAIERQSGYLSTLITSETAAKEIRGYGLGNYFKDIYLKIRLELLDKKLNISHKRTQGEVLTTAIASIGFFACIGVIAVGTVNGRTSVGDITLFLVAFPQSFSLMQNISGGISIVYQNNVFVNSIFELFDLKNKFQDTPSPIPVPANGLADLELNNVSFTYPHSASPTLKNISLTIPAGKIIAIVGLNGAGKSTLIKLLSRLYDPTEGKITLGGQDIRLFKTTEYRKQVSTVFQDFYKYNVSVKDNIRFGDLEKPLEQTAIINAAVSAGADEFIKDFPDGYDTILGRLFEDGKEVSIGQWQKLAIARSFYSDANFLIFDEATSAMDAHAEKKLLDSFRTILGNRAAVMISHRHSAIKYADYIYVLSEGEILQKGTDEELLATEGDYSRLFKNSLKD
ncbi:ATP-binding cassette subfamily B protein [Pedobacter cryoconitis]|uniref:ABC transporter ATP-binding protein n=1 Tax=Pedobacter cryoconitis TaxID=188932 RepID=UPI0017E43D33|nr:ABC transporter ATP-binding protein [Pedobacter cryoconitis]MBB6269806.1 ATP-binding cassette subfamily B protein [Pedobacter cryoconitis]